MRQPALFDDPADDPVPRRDAEGVAVGRQADIVYVDRLARSVLNPPESTGMPYWSLNPYVGCAFGCAYCYARYAHRYTTERLGEAWAGAQRDETLGSAGGAATHSDWSAAQERAAAMPSWLAFERQIFVKRNAPVLVRSALARANGGRGGRLARLVRGESLVIGTATDPYQPAERHFRITRQIFEELAEHVGLRIVLITKSALVTRDIDVLTRVAARSRLTVHLSLITLDRELARRLEPRAPTPEARVRALRRLRDAGLDVGINVMPILPGITDGLPELSALIQRVAACGATHVNAGPLRLQAEARRRYLPFVESEFPHLAARYRATYGRDHEIGQRYQEGLSRVVRTLCARYGIRWGARGLESRKPVAPTGGEQLGFGL